LIKRWLAFAGVLAALAAGGTAAGALGGAHVSDAETRTQYAVVASVSDGDTLTVAGGQRIRLLQIDSPELGSGECYSRAARTALLNLAPIGSQVVLETDPALDEVDRYGRLLRYLKRGSLNVNVELVRRGAAAPYFGGETGRYAERLLSAAKSAKAARRGMWGASKGMTLDPFGPVETGKCGPTSTPSPPSRCDPSYAGACVPPYPPDLDCGDVRAAGLALPVRVVGGDPHGFDGDDDGFGCE
jgi:micrococcal nuclease